MKKILYSVMALAIAAMTFTACEDVPEPYPTPVPGQKPVVTYEGEGTLEKPYTVADAINYAKSFGQANSDKAVYIKGYITTVTEEFTTNFGNATFEISDSKDGGNKFIFWRGLYLGNKKYSSGKTQIKVGDEVIICGKVVNYKGNTPETVQGEAFLYSLNGVNEGGGGSDTPAEAKGSGTLEDPFNPAGAVAYAKSLGSDVTSDKDVYIKGKIATIGEEYSTNFGNATFYISEDGEDSNTFYVFRAMYLGNRKFKSGDTQIKVGDDVIVCGKVVNFKGNTPETAQNSSYLYSLNGVTEGGDTPDTPGTPAGSGTQADPYNVAKALQVCAEVGEAGTANEVYAKGIVTSITEISTQYGNGTFVISDDATGSNKLTVYRAYSLGNEKFKGENEIKVGDEVVIYGKLVNFKSNTPEFTQGCYIYSLNGKTEGGGGTPTPQPGGEVKTVTVADFNAAAESNDVWYQLTGTVKNLKDGDQYGNFDLEDATGSVYVYGLLSEKGGEKKKFQELVAAKGIKNGCTLTIIGTRGSYTDKIEWMNAYFVSIEGGDTPGGGGGDTPGGGGGTTVTSLTNGDFEAWSGNQPTGWKSASTASSATLAQSTDAHGGSYSVNVNGKEGSNVRLASQEITLAAGTYVFSFYAKATTADASQVRPGYVPVADGKVGSYAYGDYANVSNTSWTQVTHEFTLDAETTVCLVVMNPKKSGYSSGKDVLVDDATLTKK